MVWFYAFLLHIYTILGKILLEVCSGNYIIEKEKNVMNFPNAAKGVKKIFTAEILGLISFIILGISSVVIIGAAGSADQKAISNSAASGAVLGGGVFATIGAIIAIVGAIINIVGLVQAGKDEKFFKYALYAMIIFFIVSLIVNMALSTSGYKDYVSSGSKIINLVVNVLVIQGVINLANAKQDEKVASKGLLVFKLIIVVTVLEIIASIIAAATQNTVAAAIVLVIAIVALILGIVRYFIYLSMLSNAKKMLADDKE